MYFYIYYDAYWFNPKSTKNPWVQTASKLARVSVAFRIQSPINSIQTLSGLKCRVPLKNNFFFEFFILILISILHRFLQLGFIRDIFFLTRHIVFRVTSILFLFMIYNFFMFLSEFRVFPQFYFEFFVHFLRFYAVQILSFGRDASN